MTGEPALRVALLLILVTAISISGYYRSRARRLTGTVPRGRDGGALIALRLLFAVPLVAAIVTWLVAPGALPWSRLPLPPAARWLGVLLGLVCVPLVWWVVSSLGANISETVLTKPRHELVTHGPFARVRHPLYTTGLLLLVAASLVTASAIVAGLTFVAGLGIAAVVVPREEAALVDRFGDRYIEYRARTGRFLPRLRPTPPA